MSILEEKANLIASEMQNEVNPTVAFDPMTILAIISLITQVIRLYKECSKSPTEAAQAMSEPNWWQRWRLRRMASQVVRESGANNVVVSHVVDGVLRQGKKVSAFEVAQLFEEV